MVNLALLLAVCVSATTAQLVSHAGDTSVIPGWNLQSSAKLSTELSNLSLTGANVSEWYRVSYRGTVFAGLIENKVYNDTELFFSENLETLVDYSDFEVPWVFREEFEVTPQPAQHYYLNTHGITSRADIYINGQIVATNETQVGSYGGRRYEITSNLESGLNCVQIVAYPTNYLRDFAMGFVDWNPYPPDNGTGVWREVSVSQAGPVVLAAPRVKTDFEYAWKQPVTVVVRVDVLNSANATEEVTVEAVIRSPDGQQYSGSATTSLEPGMERTVSMVVDIAEPQVWWPAQWGGQPLYALNVSASVNGSISDIAEARSFGVRHVSSFRNGYNDTAFLINGHPFLVQGAGYSADIFYRFDRDRARQQLQLVLDMGLNTIRLEGKQEHPDLYELADQVGVMIMAGWECCDKWEGWEYNDEADGVKWTEPDYATANASMLHEASRMQTHPSFLAFLVGSDFWPNDRATQIYVDALGKYDWPNPIIASAAERGYPELLGISGMKMEGPYDWVPNAYWWADELGAAFGFGSELGSGVGTPEIGSLTKFLSQEDLNDLWQEPDKDLYHMSTNMSSFYDRSIYNEALYNKYGAPTSLDDYLLKAQIMDYEATRSQFEAFAARKTDKRPATGLIYWMLNGAWPNLHWQLFNYYLAAGGSYYGTKVGTRPEHVVYSYKDAGIYVVSHALNSTGSRNVTIDMIDLNGTSLAHTDLSMDAFPNSAQWLDVVNGTDDIVDVAFLKLLLTDGEGTELSRNVYWLTAHNDVMNWTNSSWYSTPVTEYADLTTLFSMQNASLSVSVGGSQQHNNATTAEVTLDNQSGVPAWFIRLTLVDANGDEVLPTFWSDNYVTLFPNEMIKLQVSWESAMQAATILVSGGNVGKQNVTVGAGAGR